MSDHYDPHEPDAIDAEKAWQAGRENWLSEAWDWVLRDARGRSVLADILLTTGEHQPSYVPGSFDGTAYREGMRAVGLAVRAKIELKAPELLPDIDASLRGLASDGGRAGDDGE